MGARRAVRAARAAAIAVAVLLGACGYSWRTGPETIGTSDDAGGDDSPDAGCSPDELDGEASDEGALSSPEPDGGPSRASDACTE